MPADDIRCDSKVIFGQGLQSESQLPVKDDNHACPPTVNRHDRATHLVFRHDCHSRYAAVRGS